ncbi:MAG: peptide ABC transporter substrate-binding protein [Chloroflexi bacterium]|nr:peptide ABC transporter substrate-binding protein [Chloroflexota bacterium]
MVNRLRLQVLVASVGFFAIAIALAYFLLVVSRSSTPVAGGTYVEGVVLDTASPLVINPILSANSLSDDVASLVFSGLTRSNEKGEIVPDLADVWGPLDEGKSWEFHIRTTARWHDGQPVTSRDLLFTLDLIRSDEFPGPAELKAAWKNIEVDRLGDYRVRFRLKEVWTPFLNYTTFGLLPEHLLKDKITAKDLGRADFNLDPIGSGPYRLAPSGIANDGVTLLANPLYYGQKPYLDKVWFRYFPSSKAALTALRTNQIDGISYVPPDELKLLEGDKNSQQYSAPLAPNTFLFFNLQKTELFGQKEVRQAIAYSIDKQALIDRNFAGRATASESPIPSYLWAYKSDIKKFDFQPALARKMLDDAGWKVNAEGVRQKEGSPLVISILTANTTDQQAIAFDLAEYLKGVGIAAPVRVAPSPRDLANDITSRHFDMLLIAAQGAINDPDVYPYWHSSETGPQGFNFSGWSNDQADQLLEKARRNLNQGERQLLYNQWQDLWVNDLPSIPLYYRTYTYAISNRVGRLAPLQLKLMYSPSDRLKDIPLRYVLTSTKFGS